MKTHWILTLCCAVCLTTQAQVKTTTTVTRFSSDPVIYRVVKTPAGTSLDALPESPSVVLTPESSATSISVTYLVDDDGSVRFIDRQGQTVLQESGCRFEPIKEGPDADSYRLSQSFVLDDDEPLYGVGMLQNGKLSQRGEDRLMVQSNVEDFANIFVSPKGYALFWDNLSPTHLDSRKGLTLTSQVADAEVYYLIVADDLNKVVKGIRKLTGHVPMMPLWTYGYHQSRERYKSQHELLEVVNGYRRRGIPLDGIIQDWQYWGNNYLWNAMEFLNEDFPNPQLMVDSVHHMGAHMSISIWQSFGPQTKPYRELAEKNLMLDFNTWPYSGLPYWPPRKDYPSGVRCYDVYSAEARDIYWKHLRRLYDMDIDAWWMDSTDPDCEGQEIELEGATSAGSWRRVRNAFPIMTVGGVYDHQRATQQAEPESKGADKRVFILTRSYFAGQQRYGANTWSGDTGSSWDALRAQIPLCLNATLTGNPHVNSDIGGFFPGPYNRQTATCARNPLFQELYVRWLQFGLFCPMMRSHGESSRREIWEFGKEGEPIYDAIASTIRMRYTLMPYIYSTSWQVTNNDDSFMRALVMDFTDDRNTWNIPGEFMFGQSLLTAPVSKALFTSERRGWSDEQPDWNAAQTFNVYLPAGTRWYDWWTGTRYEGGQTLTADAPIAHSPLYVREGSIIPLGPDVQYTGEKVWDDLEVVVWRGRDADFTLYEDEGDSYRYEEGVFSTIPMHWNDRSHTLTIGKRTGSWPGMPEQRSFRIRLHDGKTVNVTYRGRKMNVKL